MQAMVSIGIAVWNGEAFLAETLESILMQNYRNIEVIILDNISIDRTSEICREFARRDNRVKYILDDVQRDVIEAQRKVVHLATGDYIMLACDDDWYAPEYIEMLLPRVMANSSIGLAYSGWGSIGPDGLKEPVESTHQYCIDDSLFKNFASYLWRRAPIPIFFGITRTNIFRDALHFYYKPDHRGWNHDNLYMLRLLSIARVDSIPDILFYYRQRDRVALYKERGQWNQSSSEFIHYLTSVRHQVSVSKVASKIIDISLFSTKEKCALKIHNLLALLYISRPRPKFISQIKRQFSR
jgi:glycosyltransferase involved in cell wall biosynthesis